MNRSPRVLIVEHDHAMRHGVCLHLELDGCACYAVPNVTSAIHRDDLGSFDLVLCGLTAGLFEAQHIIDAVRRASGGTYVPILMLASIMTLSSRLCGPSEMITSPDCPSMRANLGICIGLSEPASISFAVTVYSRRTSARGGEGQT